MPQLGETVTEGKIVKWFKSAGDAVKPGDNLFEIETDKTSMEVPATSAGTLSAINFGVGEVAKVGAVVAVLSGAGETASAAPASAPKAPLAPRAAAAPMQVTQTAPTPRAIPMDPWREVRSPERNFGPAKTSGGAFTTPLARRLAGERGIDLSRISGSGPHGRIVARDVADAKSGKPRPRFYLAVAVALGFALYRQRWTLAAVVAVTPVAAVWLSRLCKQLFGRQKEGTVAYPSGHTTVMVTVLGMLILVLGARLWVVLAATVWALLGMVGQAVTYHYFTDTVGALLLGSSVVCIAAAVVHRARHGSFTESSPRR